MANIVINEIDETTSGQAAASTDIVYIPGFATTDVAHITAASAVGANIPTLCRTVAEFEAYFGNVPATFTTNQAYPIGFSANATPATGNMCDAESQDKSYIMARELIALGIPVLYERINLNAADISVAAMYAALSGANVESGGPDVYTALQDKGEYTVKYLTSGAYPVFEYSGSAEVAGNVIVTKMLATCATRGDCVAIIDHTNNPARSMLATDTTSVFYAISNIASGYTITDNNEYGAMFTPWCSYTCARNGTTEQLPASYGYFSALAKSIKINPNWLSIAGVARGNVPNFVGLATTSNLTNAIADSYQGRTGITINPITNIKPYGYTIWGNRTLKNNAVNLTVTSFLNTRNLVSDVKKIVYTAARSLTFEQNSDVLWINFKSMITPTLDQMFSGYGISGYKIIKGTTTEKAKLVAIIRLYAVYAVEDFDITIVLSDDEIAVS